MKNAIRKITVILLAALMLAGSFSVCAFAAGGEFEAVADLDGENIAVQTAVLYEEMLADRCPNAVFQYYTMPNDMILALTSGKVSAYLIEEVSYYVQKANHPELDFLEEPAGISTYACVIGNNEKQDTLLAQMNEFIADMTAAGTLAEMYEYWIKNFDPDTSTADITGFTGENGEISIAVEGGYEPFSFVSDGDLSGYDVDFMCRFCRAYGYTPNFYEVPFESIAPGAETGKYDVGMNIVVSDERSEGAVLSDVYITSPIILAVLGEDDSAAGFFAKIANSFNKTFIKENRWKMFLEGTGETIAITLCSIVCGTLLGFGVYMLCRHGNPVANGMTKFFLWLIQGMPTVVFLMILYYIIFGSTRLSGMWVSVIGFTLIFGCSMFDMLCVGCGAIGKGQTEASRALGYSDSQSFFRIILPQAARHFLPIYRNEVVTLIKETSVVGYIAVLDLTKISDLVRSRTYEAFFPLICTAAVYFIIAAAMTQLVKCVEVRLDPKHRKKEKILAGIVTEE